jgi:hypothetical protein
MNLTYIFFREAQSMNAAYVYTDVLILDRGMKAQGFDLTKNAYHNSWQPYVAYWGVFWTLLFTLIVGFQVFFNFNAGDFLTNCPYLHSLSSDTRRTYINGRRYQHPDLCRFVRRL